MNKITITGRLTRDVEMKVVGDGIEQGRFSVAVDRRVKKGAEKKADFFNCVAWRQTGAFVSQYFHKGDGIVVTGRMESNKGNDDKTYWSLIVEDVEFPVGGRKGDAPAADPETAPADQSAGFTAVETDELPFE